MHLSLYAKNLFTSPKLSTIFQITLLPCAYIKCTCNIVSAMLETGASIQYTIDRTIEGEMCIECVFSDESTEFCVVIVHETLACNTPPPCKQSLTNINASFKFARSGDKASGCIESVDSKFYQVGVIGGQPASGTSLSKGVRTSYILSIHANA